jgi:hypothetical protein
MQLQRLAYVSEARIDAACADLADIRKVSVTRNALAGVTGALYFDGAYFVQALEGSGDALDAIMASIRRDHRHENVQMILRHPVSERRFPEWSLKIVEGASFAHLGRYFHAPRLRAMNAGAVERRLRLLRAL